MTGTRQRVADYSPAEVSRAVERTCTPCSPIAGDAGPAPNPSTPSRRIRAVMPRTRRSARSVPASCDRSDRSTPYPGHRREPSASPIPTGKEKHRHARQRPTSPRWALVAGRVALGGLWPAPPAVALGSDHQDTPFVELNPKTDMTDVYAFPGRRRPHRAGHGHPRLSHAGRRPIRPRLVRSRTCSTSSRSTTTATPRKTRSSR